MDAAIGATVLQHIEALLTALEAGAGVPLALQELFATLAPAEREGYWHRVESLSDQLYQRDLAELLSADGRLPRDEVDEEVRRRDRRWQQRRIAAWRQRRRNARADAIEEARCRFPPTEDARDDEVLDDDEPIALVGELDELMNVTPAMVDRATDFPGGS